MKEVWRFVWTALMAGLAAAAAFAGGESEGEVQMSAPAAEMMAEYSDVWQWDTLQEYEADTGNKITRFGEEPPDEFKAFFDLADQWYLKSQ